MKHARTLVTISLLAAFIFPMVSTGVSATTQEQAITAGPGFHEPSNDWYDDSYKYRIPVNVSSTVQRDTGIASFDVDFSDYFTDGSGIIDLASMQLVHYSDDESSIPIEFQVETDSVDIWNAPTLQEVEDVILGSLISDSATFIGRTSNIYEGSGLMDQSIRFEAYLREPRSTVLIQFIYDAPASVGIGSGDYLQLYAGVPGNWGSPIRIYKSMLPTEKRWTRYFAIPLEETMSGKVWIVMEAPTLLGGSEIKFFSIDFSFVDGSGFDRNVEHYLPDLDIAGKNIRQDNYYPRVHVLENEDLPTCKVYFNNVIEGAVTLSKYYLYFNFMNESNGRVIDNDAVKITGELSIPQTYFKLEFGTFTFIIDKDQIGSWEGSISVYETDNLVEGLMQVVGMSGSAPGYEVTNRFGAMFSQVIFKTDAIEVTMTVYNERNLIEVSIVQETDIEVFNFIDEKTSTSPLTIVGDDTTFTDVTEVTSGSFEGESSRITLLNPDDDVYLAILFDRTVDYHSNVDLVNEVHDLTFSPGTTTMLATIQACTARESYSSDSGVTIMEDAEELQSEFDARIGLPLEGIVGDTERPTSMEIFVLDAKTGFLAYQTVGDKINIALFGNNLQSITVEIPGHVAETATNGIYTIPTIPHEFFDASYKFVFKGRDEFGSVVTKEVSIVVADNLLDVVRVLIISTLFLPLVGIGATALSLVSVVVNKRKKGISQVDCVKGEDGKCLLDG